MFKQCYLHNNIELTVHNNVFMVNIIVICALITVNYCKCILLLYNPLISYHYVHWILYLSTLNIFYFYCALNGKSQNHCLVWSKYMINTFTAAITSIDSATLLALPLSDVPSGVTNDV